MTAAVQKQLVSLYRQCKLRTHKSFEETEKGRRSKERENKAEKLKRIHNVSEWVIKGNGHVNAGACCCFDEATLANRCPCQALPALHDVLPVLLLLVVVLLLLAFVVVVCQAKVKVKVVASRHELTTSLKTVSLIHVQHSFKHSPSLHFPTHCPPHSFIHWRWQRVQSVFTLIWSIYADTFGPQQQLRRQHTKSLPTLLRIKHTQRVIRALEANEMHKCRTHTHTH